MSLNLDPYYFDRQPIGKTPGHETCDFGCEYCDNCIRKEQAQIDLELKQYLLIQVLDQSDHVYCRHLYMSNKEKEYRINNGEVSGIPF